jgi:hypothetical protein
MKEYVAELADMVGGGIAIEERKSKPAAPKNPPRRSRRRETESISQAAAKAIPLDEGDFQNF